MDITNDSIVSSVIDYANVKFGVELTKERVSTQLKHLSLGKTLDLVDAIKADDDELFLDYIDINMEEQYNNTQSDVEEAYGTTGTATASRATVRKQNTTATQQNRAAKLASVTRTPGGERTAAGSAKTPTGKRAPADDDRAERAGNTAMAQGNAAEIDRLKDLVMKVAKGK